MDAYTAFAKVYDRLMENIPYELWAERIDEWIGKFGITKAKRNSSDPLESERNLVLDLGCGTGVLTRLMYEKGYDLIGADISSDMLDVAQNHDSDASRDADINPDPGIMYICQDMCELDLYSTVGTVYSSCDTINYLLEDEEVEACFRGVSKFLYPGGIFIFDFNTIHKYRDVIGESTIAENTDDVSFIWENYFDGESNINECDLSLFIRREDEGLYEKCEETHFQRGFSLPEIRDFLKKAGLNIVKIADEREVLAGDKPTDAKGSRETEMIWDESVLREKYENSERIFVIARKEA